MTGEYAEICAQLADRWTLLTGDTIVPGVIRFENRVGFETLRSTSEWLLKAERPPKGRQLSRHFARNIVPHEAAHNMFAGYVSDLDANWDGYRYGSTAPDWLDESAAIWVESDSMRNAMLDSLRGAGLSLATILTMEHPNRLSSAQIGDPNAEFKIIERVVVPPCPPCTWLHDTLRTKYRVQSIRVFRSGHVDTVATYADRDAVGPQSFEVRQFYPLAYSVLRFLHDRGGSAAFRELVARYRADPTPRETILNGLPGMPDTFAEVEREWQQFLNSR